MADFRQEGTFKPDTLLIEQGLARKVVIKQGSLTPDNKPLPRGAVLGKIAATRKYTLSLAAANDGSQVPDMILSEPVDASAGDVEAIAYLTGRYNSNALFLGTGHTVASVDDAFRGKSLFIEASMPYPA